MLLLLTPYLVDTAIKRGWNVLDTYYGMKITPVIHYTMGGVAINSRANVLSKNGRPIPGLYAAGEIIGGIHGRNRLAGNSLLDCVVFGQIAGSL